MMLGAADPAGDPQARVTAAFVTRAQNEQRTLLGGSALSVVLHLLLAVLILFYWPHRGGKSGARSKSRSTLVISLERGDARKTVTPPVPPAPPVIAKLPPPAPLKPTPPVPPKPRVEQPPKPQQQASAASKAASTSNADKQKSQLEVDPNADAEAFLQGVRGNWLQPPGSRRDFRCRIKIDYQPGGIISAVTVQEGCGGALLDDSVQRAVWKTQPLPIPAARTQSGNVVIEFTP